MRRLILIWALLLIPITTFGAITVDNNTTRTRSNGSSATTLSWTHTVTNANSVLLVEVSSGTMFRTVSGVSWGGISGTLIASETTYAFGYTYLFKIQNASVTGAKNITVTTSARGDISCVAQSYNGVKWTGTPVVVSSGEVKSLTISATVLYPESWFLGAGYMQAANGTWTGGTGVTIRGQGKATGVTTTAMLGDAVATPGAFTWIAHLGTTASFRAGYGVELGIGTYTVTPTVTQTITSTPIPTITITNTPQFITTITTDKPGSWTLGDSIFVTIYWSIVGFFDGTLKLGTDDFYSSGYPCTPTPVATEFVFSGFKGLQWQITPGTNLSGTYTYYYKVTNTVNSKARLRAFFGDTGAYGLSTDLTHVVLTATPTVTSTPTITVTSTSTPTATITATETNTQTVTATSTDTVTSTVTATTTPTTTQTTTPTTTHTVTQTTTQTITDTVTPTVTASITHTVTQTITNTVTPTVTITVTPIAYLPQLAPCSRCKFIEWKRIPGVTFYKVYGNKSSFKVARSTDNISTKWDMFRYEIRWLNVYKENEVVVYGVRPSGITKVSHTIR